MTQELIAPATRGDTHELRQPMVAVAASLGPMMPSDPNGYVSAVATALNRIL